jgi:hypothetical protein
MSTTSHKSHTRILSEAAMKERVHTSREDRDLTGDGLDKHHHEANTLKALEKAAAVKRKSVAQTTSQLTPNRSRNPHS